MGRRVSSPLAFAGVRGVSATFLSLCVCVFAQLCPTLCDPMDCRSDWWRVIGYSLKTWEMKSEARGLGQKTGSWKLTMIFHHKGFDPWPGRISHAAEQPSLCTTASETRVPRARDRQQEGPEPQPESRPVHCRERKPVRHPRPSAAQDKQRSGRHPHTAPAKIQRKDWVFSNMIPKGWLKLITLFPGTFSNTHLHCLGYTPYHVPPESLVGLIEFIPWAAWGRGVLAYWVWHPQHRVPSLTSRSCVISKGMICYQMNLLSSGQSGRR